MIQKAICFIKPLNKSQVIGIFVFLHPRKTSGRKRERSSRTLCNIAKKCADDFVQVLKVGRQPLTIPIFVTSYSSYSMLYTFGRIKALLCIWVLKQFSKQALKLAE